MRALEKTVCYAFTKRACHVVGREILIQVGTGVFAVVRGRVGAMADYEEGIRFACRIPGLLRGFFSFLFFWFIACQQAYAATPEEIKAAYLYQFIKYVEWPAKNAPRTEVVICLLGDSSLYRILNQKAGAVVEGKRLVIKQASRAEEVGAVHLLFVGEDFSAIGKAISTFNPKGVLTVGESPHFAKSGGMINFVIPEDTVQFEINWEEAKAQGITLSSKLLQLATIVSTER